MNMKNYFGSFSLSALLHVLIIAIASYSFNFISEDITPEIKASQLNLEHTEHIKEEIVEAIMIDEVKLNQEIAKVKNEHQLKKEKELAELSVLQARADKALRARRAEEKKIADLKFKLNKQKSEGSNLSSELASHKKELELLKKEREKLEVQRKKLLSEAKKADLAKNKAVAKQKAIEKEQALIISKRNEAVNNQVKKYAALIRDKVVLNWNNPLESQDGLSSLMTIRTSVTGQVLEVVIARSSGNESFDRAAELAVLKSSPFPMPIDEEVQGHFRLFSFTFKPEHMG